MVGHCRTNSTSLGISFNSTVIGEYTLGKTLGEGSCAVVKLGTHCFTGQKVAVKIIKPNSLQEQKEVIREVESLQVLKDHPHIIKLIQTIKENGYTCLILELGEGGELFNHIVDSGRIDELQARKFFRQIVSGVLYSHANLVVHRDLKPENIILDGKGNVKVSDFGLSNILRPGMLFTTFCGSPVYTSPEVVMHKQYNGTMADVWSLGAVLYVMVTGGMPWRLEKNAVKNMDQLLAAKFKLPDSLGLSEEVKDLIRKMLTADAKDRATLEQVASHPWLCKGYDGPPKTYLKAKPLVASDRINENVLEHLTLLGMDIQKARETITKDVHSPALTAYHLLMEKHTRACRVATDYKTVNASNIPADDPNLSPTRSRARSAPSANDKSIVPTFDRVLALKTDPLACRSASAIEKIILEKLAPLSLSSNLAELGWNPDRTAPAQPSSVNVPRRSVELRDLFSAPSMPATEASGIPIPGKSELLPTTPLKSNPFYNPFSAIPEADESVPVFAPTNPFVVPASIPLPPSPRDPNPFAREDTADTQSDLVAIQHALLFPSRTDSPTNVLTSPHIPPVTVIPKSGNDEAKLEYVEVIMDDGADMAPATVYNTSLPHATRQKSHTVYTSSGDAIVHAAKVAPGHRHSTAFKSFFNVFRRGGSKNSHVSPPSAGAVPDISVAPKVSAATSLKSHKRGGSGSSLKMNASPNNSRRSIFSKN